MLNFALDLSTASAAALAEWVEQAKQQNCTFSTLHEPDAHKEQIYWLHQECRKRQPPVETRHEPQDYNRWVEIFAGPHAHPNLYHVISQHGQNVGVSCLVKTDDASVFLCGFTGILPSHSGQGLARAIKAHVLRAAKEQGIKRVVTQVRADNPSMLKLNRQLGFASIEAVAVIE